MDRHARSSCAHHRKRRLVCPPYHPPPSCFCRPLNKINKCHNHIKPRSRHGNEWIQCGNKTRQQGNKTRHQSSSSSCTHLLHPGAVQHRDVIVEREASAQEHVDNNSEAPHVDRLRVRPPLQHLRGDITLRRGERGSAIESSAVAQKIRTGRWRGIKHQPLLRVGLFRGFKRNSS